MLSPCEYACVSWGAHHIAVVEGAAHLVVPGRNVKDISCEHNESGRQPSSVVFDWSKPPPALDRMGGEQRTYTSGTQHDELGGWLSEQSHYLGK